MSTRRTFFKSLTGVVAGTITIFHPKAKAAPGYREISVVEHLNGPKARCTRPICNIRHGGILYLATMPRIVHSRVDQILVDLARITGNLCRLDVPAIALARVMQAEETRLDASRRERGLDSRHYDAALNVDCWRWPTEMMLPDLQDFDAYDEYGDPKISPYRLDLSGPETLSSVLCAQQAP